MKKWYKSALCKGLLVLAAHVSAAALAVCITIGFIYPGENYGELFLGKEKNKYEDTKGFAGRLMDSTWEILNQQEWDNTFLTEGKLDLEKVVDVEQFYKDSQINAEQGELSYRLGDIVQRDDSKIDNQSILVCERPDGDRKYDYRTVTQFMKEAKENGYSMPDEEYTTEEVLSSIEEYAPPRGEVIDKDGKQVYSSIWYLGDGTGIDMAMKTVSGKNIVELANESEKWNGKLTEMQGMVEHAIGNLTTDYDEYMTQINKYDEGETNLSYLYINYDTGKIQSNMSEYKNKDVQAVSQGKEIDLSPITSKGKYVLIAPTLAECETNMDAEHISLSQWKLMVQGRKGDVGNYRFVVAVDTTYPIQDEFYEQNHLYTKYMPWVSKIIVIGVLSIIVFFICLIWLTAVAGRSNNGEEVALVFFDKWKTEIWFCLMVCIGALAALPISLVDGYIINWYDIVQNGMFTIDAILVFAVAAVLMCACVLTVYLSLVRVLKAKTLWKNSILKWLCHTMKYIWKNRSSITKLIVICVGLFLVNIMVMTGSGFFVLLAMAVDITTVIYMAKLSIERTRIKKGIMKIAAGDVEYKISLDNLTGDNKEMAEMVNHIGEGIQNAVEKSLKDERLKTDLITNVSHDIKTPLTSIINYVGLLKQEKFDDPKIQRYLDILDQKSQRLKTLTEDVVEASKISSGNINLEFINLNLVEMIHQTTGEFTEKFEKKGLKAVVTVPEEPAIVRVDGRRMWRVIENIYNNAAKYAMPGTRVYADLSMNKNLVVFSLKNVSEYPLNITADELTERFIRGDVSRSTEGSGLGLSIAQNLTKMQGGEFKLYVDGDLFKVTITFPRICPKAEYNMHREAKE